MYYICCECIFNMLLSIEAHHILKKLVPVGQGMVYGTNESLVYMFTCLHVCSNFTALTPKCEELLRINAQQSYAEHDLVCLFSFQYLKGLRRKAALETAGFHIIISDRKNIR